MNIILIVLGFILIMFGAYGCIRDALIEEDIKALQSDRSYLEYENKSLRAKLEKIHEVN